MAQTILRDKMGKIIATVDVDSHGNKTLRDFYGHILGTYSPKFNLTKDFYGHIVGQGDVLTMLIK